MCFSISVAKNKSQLEKKFKAKLEPSFEFEPVSFITAFTKPLVSIITNDKQDYIQLYNWGLIPHWVKSEEQAKDIATKTFNARSETAHQKPSFRDAFKTQRCLVLADGFFEWKTEGKIKTPHHIYLKEHEPFAFAGIYNSWVNKETGEIQNTFSILTQEANPYMAEIHNLKKRQPIIVHNQQTWLENGDFNTILNDSYNTQFCADVLERDFRKRLL